MSPFGVMFTLATGVCWSVVSPMELLSLAGEFSIILIATGGGGSLWVSTNGESPDCGAFMSKSWSTILQINSIACQELATSVAAR